MGAQVSVDSPPAVGIIARSARLPPLSQLEKVEERG